MKTTFQPCEHFSAARHREPSICSSSGIVEVELGSAQVGKSLDCEVFTSYRQ